MRSDLPRCSGSRKCPSERMALSTRTTTRLTTISACPTTDRLRRCYVANQRQIDNNRVSMSAMVAPRDGRSLLAGLLVCGQCGGGFTSQHEMIGSVGRYEQLRDFKELKARILELD